MTYNDLVNLLEQHYQISPDSKAAFLGRLKHLQRNSWPVGANTGKGKRAWYTKKMVTELFFATELTSIGITPERAIDIVKSNLPNMHDAFESGAVVALKALPAFGDKQPSPQIHIDMKALKSLISSAP